MNTMNIIRGILFLSCHVILWRRRPFLARNVRLTLGCTGRLQVSIKVAGEAGIEGTTAGLRGVWEATSFQLERLQCDPACVEQEASNTTPKT